MSKDLVRLFVDPLFDAYRRVSGVLASLAAAVLVLFGGLLLGRLISQVLANAAAANAIRGGAAAGALRDHPRASKVPVLVVTAKGDLRPLFAAMPQVAGFFQKPFDPRLLREAVERAVAPK